MTARSVLREWKLVTVVFAVTSIITVAYLLAQPPAYESEAVVSFRPRPDQVSGRDLTSLLVETYPELVASPEATSGAATAAGVTASEVSDGLSTQIAARTLNLQIAVSLGSPQRAQTATQHLVDLAVAAGQEDPFLEPVPLAEASLPDAPAGLPRSLLSALAIVISAGIAVLVGVLAAQLRIKRPEGQEPGPNAS